VAIADEGIAPAGSAARRLSARRAALGVLPTQDTIVLERFFDESGGMQLVIHSPFGSRINRAWGSRCASASAVKFNFELQAAATEDAIVLSLSTSHSFALAACARYSAFELGARVLVPGDARGADVRRALALDRGTSLALPRFRGGKKVAAPLQRMRADDCMASVFPDQTACADNIVGDREIPDHPLVRQVDRRLPARRDGHRGPRALLARHRSGRRSASSRATCPRRRRSRSKC
jgi:ATP-dependent Lhr-like helicase